MRRKTRTRRRWTTAQRNQILVAYERSDLPPKAFAAQAGVGYSTLTRWLKETTSVKPGDGAGFVPVPNLLVGIGAPAAYRVRLAHGVIVEVAPGFQAAELGRLLQQVQRL